jgi:hypothetical protein
MFDRVYQFFGVSMLAGYALATFLGWEFGKTLLAQDVPPVNAVVSSGGSGWSGRTSTYRAFSYSSSGTRSGVGGGFGGK